MNRPANRFSTKRGTNPKTESTKLAENMSIQRRPPHMLFDSQIVVDIKPPQNLHKAAVRVGHLYTFLKGHVFIPAEKFTGDLTVNKVSADGTVEFQLTGSSMGAQTLDGIQPSIQLTLPLGLAASPAERNVQDVFSALPGTVVEDGGNVQNMLLNTLMLAEALAPKYPEFDGSHLHISAVSSSDPFRRVAPSLGQRFQDRVRVYPLGLPDRHAILLPYEREGQRGILSITSEPALTSPALRELARENEQFAKALSSSNCFVSADPLFELLPSHAVPPYAMVVNAATALRALVALQAYNTCALLPMNDGEAGEVCRLMLSRACSTELTDTQAPRFPSPLSLSDDSIDAQALKTLDASLDMFARYNPPFRNAHGLGFACPISFGREGGLIIGTNHRVVACFSSILSAEGERKLFDEYGFPWLDKLHETGAGDSVAAVNSLFNTVLPDTLILPLLEGRETANRDLLSLADALFVSTLGRLVGNLLIRTTMTNLTGVNIDALSRLLDDAASECVKLARKLVKLLPNPTFGALEKWGIRFAVWTPRQVIFPNGTISIG